MGQSEAVHELQTAPDTVSRTKATVHPTERHDGLKSEGDGPPEIRVYFNRRSATPPMPSVSVIKNLRVDPEKAEALEGWRTHYDGQSGYARPWWKDQMAYKANRGTLIHFAILDALGDAASEDWYHTIGDSAWGREEYEAEYALKKWSLQAPSANTDEVPYTPRANKYDGEHAWDRAVREMRWATKAFKQRCLDGEVSSHYQRHDDDSPVTGRLGSGRVLAVEQFVFDTEYGYGGQFDLLYDTADGTTVLADIKTSSGVRFDHKLQSAAYKRAIESATDITVDETEIIRLYPDDEVVEVSRSPQWDRTLEGLQHEFLALSDEAQNVRYQQTLAQAADELTEDNTEDT